MKLLCIAVACLSICVVFSTTVPVTKVYEKDQVTNKLDGHEKATKMAAENNTKVQDTEKVTVTPRRKTTTTKNAVDPKPKVQDTEKVTVTPRKKTTTTKIAVDPKPKDHEVNSGHKAESNSGESENATLATTAHRN